jgi:tetratricopeptide (TPR) repeat protein
VADIAEQRHLPPVWLRAAGVAVLLVLAILTYRQIGLWNDNLALWSHTLEVTRNNYLAENIVGSTLLDQGHPDEALPHFQAATQMNPSDPSAYMYIGAYDQQHGRPRQAVEQYQQAIALTDGAVQRNLWLRSTTFARMGSSYRQLGDYEQARQNFQKALELNPDDSQVWLALGIVTQLSGDPTEAIHAYSQGLRIQSSDIGYLLLARAFQQIGHGEEAQAATAEARRRSPDFSRAERSVNAVLTPHAVVTHVNPPPDETR